MQLFVTVQELMMRSSRFEVVCGTVARVITALQTGQREHIAATIQPESQQGEERNVPVKHERDQGGLAARKADWPSPIYQERPSGDSGMSGQRTLQSIGYWVCQSYQC